MTANNSVTVEAKTLEQAIVMACGKLGVAQADLQYEVVKKSAGFLNLFGGKVQISAWVKQAKQRNDGRAGAHSEQRNKHHKDRNRSNNRRDDGRQQTKGRGDHPRHDQRGERDNHRQQDQRREQRDDARQHTPPEPLAPDVQAKVIDELTDFCAAVCGKIVEAPVTVASSFDATENRLTLQIDSADIGKIIQEQIKFVEALEHLLRKKPRHLKQELPFRIFIDAHGGRKGREEELARLAVEWSQQVVETHKPMVLNYRSAADRKIIHMALENDNRVYTKSIGSGPNRKLMILPSKGNREAAAAEA